MTGFFICWVVLDGQHHLKKDVQLVVVNQNSTYGWKTYNKDEGIQIYGLNRYW
jgi:hypothetical protein